MSQENMDMNVKATLDADQFDKRLATSVQRAQTLVSKTRAKNPSRAAAEQVGKVQATYTAAAQGAQQAGLITTEQMNARMAQIGKAVDKLVASLANQLNVAASKVTPSPTRVGTIAAGLQGQVAAAAADPSIARTTVASRDIADSTEKAARSNDQTAKAAAREARAAERSAEQAERAQNSKARAQQRQLEREVRAQEAQRYKPTAAQQSALEVVAQRGTVTSAMRARPAEGVITTGSAAALEKRGLLANVGGGQYRLTKAGRDVYSARVSNDEARQAWGQPLAVPVPARLLDRSAQARVEAEGRRALREATTRPSAPPQYLLDRSASRRAAIAAGEAEWQATRRPGDPTTMYEAQRRQRAEETSAAQNRLQTNMANAKANFLAGTPERGVLPPVAPAPAAVRPPVDTEGAWVAAQLAAGRKDILDPKGGGLALTKAAAAEMEAATAVKAAGETKAKATQKSTTEQTAADKEVTAAWKKLEAAIKKRAEDLRVQRGQAPGQDTAGRLQQASREITSYLTGERVKASMAGIRPPIDPSVAADLALARQVPVPPLRPRFPTGGDPSLRGYAALGGRLGAVLPPGASIPWPAAGDPSLRGYAALGGRVGAALPPLLPWRPWAPAGAGPGPLGPRPGLPYPASPGYWGAGAASPPPPPSVGGPGVPGGGPGVPGMRPGRPFNYRLPPTLGPAEFHDSSNPTGVPGLLPADMLPRMRGWSVPPGTTGPSPLRPGLGAPLVNGSVIPPEGAGDFERLGNQEAFNLLGGKQIQIVMERYLNSMNDVMLALHAEADSLEHLRKTRQGAARETQRSADLDSGPLRRAQLEYAAALEERSLKERQINRDGRAGSVAERGVQDARDRIERYRREIGGIDERLLGAPVGGEARAGRRTVSAAEQQQEAASLIRQQQLADAGGVRGPLDDMAAADVWKQELKQQTRRRQAEQSRLLGFADMSEGTLMQRGQAWIASRQEGRQRSPLEFQKGGQFFGSKALTSAGFALTGGVMYGGLQLGKDIFQESAELQIELGIIRAQFATIGDTANSISFKGLKEQIHSISIETGVQANEVAKVIRQLSGAFADASGLPDFARAQSEATVALQYTQTSGLPQQEVTDSLTAMSLAFRDAGDTPMPFEDILDGITDLENRFGVLGPEILKFAADLAPMANQLGLDFDQLAGLGAVAQQRSGKSGAVLSEQLGRILPELSKNATPLAEVLARNPETRDMGEQMFAAFKTGDTVQGMETLINAYQKLNDKQREAVILAVGGPRQAGTFAALLDSPDQTLAVLRGEGLENADGAHKKRWDEYAKTVTYAFTQMRRSVEEFGQKLFEAGIGDALTSIAVGGKALLEVVEKLVSVFGAFNGALGGLPAKAAGAYLVMKTLSALWMGGAIGGKAFAGAGPGIASILAPTVMTAGTGGLPTFSVKDQVRKGMNSRLIGSQVTSLVSRSTQGGAIGGLAGAGATALSYAGPMLAAAGLVYGTQKVFEARAERAENEQAIEAGVIRDFSLGQTREQFIAKYAPGSTQRNAGAISGRSTAEKAGAIASNIGGYAGALWSGGWSGGQDWISARDGGSQAGMSGSASKIDVLTADGDQVAAWEARKAALDDDSKTFAVAGLSELKNLSYADRQRRFEDSGMLLGGVGNDYFRREDGTISFSKRRINRLITDYKADPGNKDLALLAQGLTTGDITRATPERGNAGNIEDTVSDAYFRAAEQAATDKDVLAVVEDIVASNEEGGTDAAYDTSVAAYQNLLKSGDTGLGTLKAVMLDQIDFQKGLVQRLRDAGASAADIAAAQQEVAASESAMVAITGETQTAADALFTKVLALKGASGLERNLRTLQRSVANQNDLRASGAATPRQLGEGAFNVIAQQQALAVGNATTAAGISRITPDAGLQSDLIAAQLGEGQVNQDALTAYAEARGIDQSQAAQELAAEIQDAGGIEELKAKIARRAELGRYRTGDSARVTALDTIQNVETDFSNLSPDEQAISKLGQNIDLEKLKAMRPSGGADSVLSAQFDLKKATESLALTPKDSEKYTERLIALEQAQMSVDEAYRTREQTLAKAADDLKKAQNYGDTSYGLKVDLQGALRRQSEARTPEESAQAAVDVQLSRNAIVEDAKRQVQERSKYRQALLQGDSVAQAREALAAAQAALASATPDQKYDAMTALLEAQRNLRTSMLDVILSEKDLAIALAEQAGDPVQVALLELQQAQLRLADAKKAGAQGAQLNAAKAEVIRAQSNVTNVTRADRLGDLEYMYEFDKLTATAYIAQLKLELKKIPESNKEARRDIERRIKSLRDEMSADLTFNIPTDINLPTLYEARRGRGETAAGNDGKGSGSYQDNRRIQVVVDGAQDPVAVAQAVVDAIGGSSMVSPTSEVGFEVGF